MTKRIKPNKNRTTAGSHWKSASALLVCVAASGCMGGSKYNTKLTGAILGSGQGGGPITFETMGGLEFSRVAGVALVPEDAWSKPRLGVWGLDDTPEALADALGGRVIDGKIVLYRRGDGCYLVEIAYGRGSLATDFHDFNFDVAGLLASGVVDNGDEFAWSRQTTERLPITAVVSNATQPAQVGYETVSSGVFIDGSLYGDVGWCYLDFRISRSSSSSGGLRVDGVEFPSRVTVRTGRWVPLFRYSDLGLAGLPIRLSAGVDVVAIKVSWLGTGTPTWLR